MLDLTPQSPPMPMPSRFVREARVGEGSVASAYRARDLASGRLVTLVQVRPEQAADAFFLARFEREARVLATIDHPNVVRLVGSGIECGIPFVAIERLPGRTLAEQVGAHGPIGAGDVVGLGRQLLAGLGAIHAAGLLHLRLTPGTVLIGDDGVVRITDVGIASLGGFDDGAVRGAAVEVARYLAPELIEGGDVCEATDLYAAAGILFEALTGRPPFPGNNPVLVRFAQVQAAPPVPSRIVTGVPPDLDGVLLRALAKDPARRYPDARSMTAALAAIGSEAVVDRMVDQIPVWGASPPRVTAARAEAEARPVAPARPVRIERGGRRRQAPGGWGWPIAIACAAIILLIGALAVSLSGDAPADEAAAGVSVAVDAKGSGQPAVPAPEGAASTATARVVRPSGRGKVAVPTANAFRAHAGVGTKTAETGR